jgi:hypothetical protein
MFVSKRELKSWSWISRELKPGMTVLAKASRNLTDSEAGLELAAEVGDRQLEASSVHAGG